VFHALTPRVIELSLTCAGCPSSVRVPASTLPAWRSWSGAGYEVRPAAERSYQRSSPYNRLVRNGRWSSTVGGHSLRPQQEGARELRALTNRLSFAPFSGSEGLDPPEMTMSKPHP